MVRRCYSYPRAILAGVIPCPPRRTAGGHRPGNEAAASNFQRPRRIFRGSDIVPDQKAIPIAMPSWSLRAYISRCPSGSGKGAGF